MKRVVWKQRFENSGAFSLQHPWPARQRRAWKRSWPQGSPLPRLTQGQNRKAKHKQGQLHGFFHFTSLNERISQAKNICIYLKCICCFKNTLSVSLHRLSLFLPVSRLPAWAGNRGKKVNLESDSACEAGLAQINRAEALPAQFQQRFPNITSSALTFRCRLAIHCLRAIKSNVYKAIAQQKKILPNGLSLLIRS